MSGDFDPFLAAEVGALVMAARKARGIPIRRLCRTIGIQQSTLWNIETGRTGASLAMLYRIALALEVRPHDLLPEHGQTESRRAEAMSMRQANAQRGANGHA